MPDFANFDCDLCGACCEALIVEADYLDAIREPRLYDIQPVDRAALRNSEAVIALYDTKTRACPFLGSGDVPGTKICGIHPTRPSACVMVEAGDAKCQQARKIMGIPLLCDRDGNEPARELLEASCDEYGLDLDDVT